MKFCVTVSRTGCLFIDADDPESAVNIANRQTTDAVNWSDDWDVTDVEVDDSAPGGIYITGDDSDDSARLLELSELRGFDGILWLEIRDSYCDAARLEQYMTFCRFSVIGRDELEERLPQLYGRNWRCWASEPTWDQRQAKPWN